MPTSLEALIVFAVFLVPGYIAMLVAAHLSARKWPAGHILLMHTIALGLLNSLLAVGLVRLPFWRESAQMAVKGQLVEQLPDMSGEQYIRAGLGVVAICFVLPAIVGVLLAWARNKALFVKIGAWLIPMIGLRVNEECWDYLFDRPNRAPLWLHVHLNDNETTYEGLTWHVSGYPSPPSVLLQYPKVRQADGEWDELTADYVLLDGKNIRAIEAYEPEESEDVQPGEKASEEV